MKPIRDGDGQSLRPLADLGESGPVVLVEVSDTVLSLSEVIESRKRLVDQGEGVATAVGLEKDVVGGSTDHLDGKIKCSLVVPPSELPSLALIVKSILAARKTVQINEDMHVVLGDGVMSDLLHSQLLTISVVVVASDGGHVCPVADRNTESFDTIGGEVVNILGRDVCVVTIL
jgi:hypothetical protein